MSFDELTEEQKILAKQDYLVQLSNKNMFVKTMKQWHPDVYSSEDNEERSPSWGEMADADNLVSDEIMRQEGVGYVPGDFGCEEGSNQNKNQNKKQDKKREKNGIETTVVDAIPQWAVDYFVNAETSGLDEEDIKLVTEYEKRLLGHGLRLITPIEGTEDAFNPYPAFGLACDTVDFEAEVLKK